MNILVTGANGQLGSSLRNIIESIDPEQHYCAKKGSDTFYFTDVTERDGFPTFKLDITNLTDIRLFVRNYEIEAIINCAAYTNVDAAEDNERMSELLNARAPEYLATAIKEVDGLLVHISTDYVFGKEPYNTPCKEDQQGTPTGVYGLTKLHGEQAIQQVGCKNIIIRTAWLYSEYGKNFVKTMLNLIATKPQLKVVFDQVGTPTYAKDLADVILTAIDDYKQSLNTRPSTLNYAKSGIYHFSNEGVCSWFDFTKMIAEYAGNTSCDILPCHSEDFPSPVKRPSFSVLDKTKIKEAFGIKVPYWTDSLKQCIANLKL